MVSIGIGIAIGVLLTIGGIGVYVTKNWYR